MLRAASTSPFAASPADLESKWPVPLATQPDFIKTYLLYSDHFASRRDDPRFQAWKGLDPALLPAIVSRVHAVRLRVSTHIEMPPIFTML